MTKTSLKDDTVKGVGWSAADTIIKYGIEFLVSLFLARLLSPSEYGLIGIITIFITVFNIIVDSGFTTALVRKNDATEEDYCTVFYCNLVVSIILAAVLFFGAPLVATFFKNRELNPLTKAMSSIIIINAFALVQKVQLTKRIDFKTQTKISIIASSTSGLIGIIMAFLGFGVWSLVGQQVSRQTINAIFLWIFNKWFPKLIFTWKSFKELFNFGWKLLVANVIGSTWDQVYYAVIGKHYSPASLGQYTRAHQFASVFSSNIGTIVQRVTFPALSVIRDDRERLRQAYRHVIKISMLITAICMFMLAAIAKPLILVLIGDKWLDCVPMLQLLCFNMVLYPLHMLNINLLSIDGRSDIQLILQVIKIVMSLVPLGLGIFVNLYWMLAASAINSYLIFFLNSYYSGKSLEYTSWDQTRDILPSYLLSLILAIPVWLITLIPISPFMQLLLQVLLGVALTFMVHEVIKLPEYVETKRIVVSYSKRFFIFLDKRTQNTDNNE